MRVRVCACDCLDVRFVYLKFRTEEDNSGEQDSLLNSFQIINIDSCVEDEVQ